MAERLEQTVTRLLHAASAGESLAAQELVPLLYDELRRIAQSQLSASSPQTLQATALVNEAYMRLVDKDAAYESRGHFFFAAARAMRDILIEQARRKRAVKRGGDVAHLPFDPALTPVINPSSALDDDLLALDEALRDFEAVDPEKARLVMMRHFAGLTLEEISQATGTPLRTLDRQWRFARAWLHDRLTSSEGPG